MGALQGFSGANSELRYIQNAAQKTELIKNATIPRSAQVDIDENIVKVFQQEETAIAALRAANLENTNLDPTKQLYTKTANASSGDATQSMEYNENEKEQDFEFRAQTFPVPVTHSSARIGARGYDAAKGQYADFDSSIVTPHAYAVRDKVNETIFTGNSKLVVDTGTLYGITNHPDRKVLTSLSTGVAATPSKIMANFSKTLSAYSGLKTQSPGILWLSLDDYAAASTNSESGTDTTYLRKLEAHPIVQSVRADSNIPNDQMVLVEARPRTIELGVAQGETSLIHLKGNSGLSPRSVYVYGIMIPMIHKVYKNGKPQVNIVHGKTS